MKRTQRKAFPKKSIVPTRFKILEKQNSLNVTKETESFLKVLKDNPTKEETDYYIKTFIRIIFKSIYVFNKEIVKVELNQPWKLCYEKGLQCQKTEKMPLKQPKCPQKDGNIPSFWRPTAGRWPQYRRIMEELIEVVAGL